MNGRSRAEILQTALKHHNSGQLQQAEILYRRVLATDPTDFDALHLLGLLAHQLGKHNQARDLISTAIQQNALNPFAHNNLGEAYRALKRLAEAENQYRQALSLKPDFAEAYYNLGTVLHQLTRFDEAEQAYRQALEFKPEWIQALNGLGNILYELGRFKEAEQACRCALAHQPDYLIAYYTLGNSLQRLGRFEEAADSYRCLLARFPEHVKAQINLGIALQSMGHLDEAERACRHAIAYQPGNVLAYNTLGIIFHKRSQIVEAENAFQHALTLAPGYAKAYGNLGSLSYVTGDIGNAVGYLRKALSLDASDAKTHSNLLYMMNYDPRYTQADMYQESMCWNSRHARTAPYHKNTPGSLPGRLKVGFVSADFRAHPVGYLMMQFLKQYAESRLTVSCYNNNPAADDLTHTIKERVHCWRDVAFCSDRELFELIENDGIDILIDLSGHTDGNRLTLFSMRPAGIRATWLGYFNTTGVTGIDYFISDEFTTPEWMSNNFSERIVCLPHSRFCYAPPEYAPEVSPLPALNSSFITFGSFNNYAKVSDPAIHLWARILKAVPDSRMVLKWKSFRHVSVVEAVLCRFRNEGVERERLIVRADSPHHEMLAEYGDIDIALDTFPFSGGLTSLEALLMGVPVVTYSGSTPASRQTGSFLRLTGLNELIAGNEDEYVDTAIKLAADPERLAGIRHNLRTGLLRSPLCDGRLFSENMMTLLEEMMRSPQ